MGGPSRSLGDIVGGTSYTHQMQLKLIPNIWQSVRPVTIECNSEGVVNILSISESQCIHYKHAFVDFELFKK